MRRWIFFALFLTGCTGPKDTCGQDFLVLWPSAQGPYEYQSLNLSTLKSPYELKGEAAEIYFESELTDSNGYIGSVARPHMTRSSGVCVPTDVGSSLAISAYAQMEKIYQFDRTLGVDQQIPWPRKIGVQVNLIGANGLVQNNALYLSQHDVMGLVPYSQNGLPTGVNLGIVAHEHFHAHFQHQVYNRLNSVLPAEFTLEALFHPANALKPSIEDVEKADLKSVRGINSFILRSWNEGLADLYGGLYTNRPDFVRESLPQLLEKTENGKDISRNLLGPIEPMATGPEFRYEVSQRHIMGLSMVSMSYREGSLLARLLYRVGTSGSEAPSAFLSRVMNRLSAVADWVAPGFDQEILDVESIIPVLLKDMPLNNGACEALKEGLSAETFERSFSSCAG